MTTDPELVPVAQALALALKFHETYERLAPSFGYETRTETRAFDPESANGRLMIAVCGEVCADHARIVGFRDMELAACDRALKQAEVDANAARVELAALRARVEAAPVVVIGNADAYSCWLEKWQGSESGPVHAMKGRRVRLVPEGSE